MDEYQLQRLLNRFEKLTAAVSCLCVAIDRLIKAVEIIDKTVEALNKTPVPVPGGPPEDEERDD